MKGLTVNDLMYYNPGDFDDTILTQEEMLGWFEATDAYWLHDGDPKKPHAELVSGLCSNGYFFCPRILKLPNINEILAQQLGSVLDRLGVREKGVTWVVGSAYSAITFSYEVAKALGPGVCHGNTEKDPENPKKQVWKRLTIPERATVLQVEELITTSKTFRLVREAIRKGNKEYVNFLPIVGTLVHRPPKLPIGYEIDDEGKKVKLQIVPLIEKEVWAVDPSECPLCKAGSKRLRPKTHWKELTGKD